MAGKAAQNKQRALVVGVSDYPAPIPKLPAVAADVREMAKLLASKRGEFKGAGVNVLTDTLATHRDILDGLKTALGGARPDETVFVYLAGHGGVEGNEYFFLAHDTDPDRLAATGVPLKEIKNLFERATSRRVLIWLDFCHSGGIIARGLNADDVTVLQRALQITQGQGKVIVAACKPTQSAYEDPSIGHGLFTHALLRGLKGGAKSAQGEVTAHSLYDFIDHQIGSRQRPMFFGEITGRIVLMHYADRSSTTTKKPASLAKKPKPRPKKRGTWILLGDNFFLAERIRHRPDGKFEVDVSPDGGEQEAALRSAKQTGRSPIPFAANNDAHVVQIDQMQSETTQGKQLWTLVLSVDVNSGGAPFEMNVQGVGPDEIARRRARRILLNDPPYQPGARLTVTSDSFLEGIIEASSSRFPIRESVIRSVYQQHGQFLNWKDFARLKAIFYLKVSGTVEHVLELNLGPVRKAMVPITFRGRRRQTYGNVAPAEIQVSGDCPLD